MVGSYADGETLWEGRGRDADEALGWRWSRPSRARATARVEAIRGAGG